MVRTLVPVIATLVLKGAFLNPPITGPVSLTHHRREKKVHCPLLEGLDPMRATSLLVDVQFAMMDIMRKMLSWCAGFLFILMQCKPLKIMITS